MTRVLIVLGGAGVVALFLCALVESAPRARVHVAVIAEPTAVASATPYVVRLSAVDVGAQRAAPATGEVRLGAQRAPFVDGVARVPIDASATALELEVEVDERPAIALRCPLRVVRERTTPTLFEPAAPERPAVAGMRTTSAALSLVGDIARVAIDVPDQDTLALELWVDGVLRDARVVIVERHLDVELALPSGVGDDAVVVVHAAEPWPLARGAFAAATRAGGPIDLSGQRPIALRPPPLACEELKPRFAHAWRTAFEVAAAVFVIALVVGLLRRARADARRGALLALASGAALAACLAGLDVMLRLGASGLP